MIRDTYAAALRSSLARGMTDRRVAVVASRMARIAATRHGIDPSTIAPIVAVDEITRAIVLGRMDGTIASGVDGASATARRWTMDRAATTGVQVAAARYADGPDVNGALPKQCLKVRSGSGARQPSMGAPQIAVDAIAGQSETVYRIACDDLRRDVHALRSARGIDRKRTLKRIRAFLHAYRDVASSESVAHDAGWTGTISE